MRVTSAYITYGALCNRASLQGVQDMSYTDSSLRFWLSPTQLKCGNTAKHHNIGKKLEFAAEFVSAVAWVYKHSEKVIRKLWPQMNGNQWKSKRKKNTTSVNVILHPHPPPVRLTNFQAVAGHRRAEGRGSRGYSKVSCTAWQIMAGSSMTRCAHHPGNTGCPGDETTSFIHHARLTRRGW